MKTTTQNFLRASRTPLTDLAKLAYAGQPENRRLYREGYESFMDELPVLESSDPDLRQLTKHTNWVMKQLAKTIKKQGWVENTTVPAAGGFNRTIIALAEPGCADGRIVEKSELVVAQWGDGHTSPVHGHANGYLFEEVLRGRIKVNSYRVVDLHNRIVRPVHTRIVGEGNLVAEYRNTEGERTALVHNFESIGYTATLHYLPEHTRDGRDNKFTVEHFSGLTRADVKRISAQEGMHLQNGEVVLVRSQNVPEYGDHFIVVTGHPVMKEHGLRVQDEAVLASPADTALLNNHEFVTGLILLKLNPDAQARFHEFHGITMNGREVLFPQI